MFPAFSYLGLTHKTRLISNCETVDVWKEGGSLKGLRPRPRFSETADLTVVGWWLRGKGLQASTMQKKRGWPARKKMVPMTCLYRAYDIRKYIQTLGVAGEMCCALWLPPMAGWNQTIVGVQAASAHPQHHFIAIPSHSKRPRPTEFHSFG